MIEEISRCLNKKGKKYCDWMAERVQQDSGLICILYEIYSTGWTE